MFKRPVVQGEGFLVETDRLEGEPTHRLEKSGFPEPGENFFFEILERLVYGR